MAELGLGSDDPDVVLDIAQPCNTGTACDRRWLVLVRLAPLPACIIVGLPPNSCLIGQR